MSGTFTGTLYRGTPAPETFMGVDNLTNLDLYNPLIDDLLGDIDGDGFNDILIGARDWGVERGKVSLFTACESLPPTAPEISIVPPYPVEGVDLVCNGSIPICLPNNAVHIKVGDGLVGGGSFTGHQL